MQFRKFCGNGREAVPQKMLEDKGQVDSHTNFGKSFDQHLSAQILAVDEHAITIKNYKGDFAQTGPGQVIVAMKKLNV